MKFSDIVKSLQNGMNALGEKLTVDGDLGPKTSAAMSKFTVKVNITKKQIDPKQGGFANVFFLIGILFVFMPFCSFAFSKSPPKQDPKPQISADEFRNELFEIATKGQCASFSYKNQGRAPSGYLKGLFLTYVKTICSPAGDVYKIGTQALGPASSDALSHYGLSPKTATDRLNATFALMIGSNARESSWRPCVGRDTLAKASDIQGCIYGSGSTCEAGLAQTSYNSVSKTGPLRDLFDQYRKSKEGCFRSEYYGKTTCSEANWKNHGTDKNAIDFQKLSKECPGFTVESGVIMFRTKRTHYGPLNKKTAEVVPECQSAFEKARLLVEKNTGICTTLF